MISYNFASGIFGTALGATILMLVRRDHLQLGHAIFWLLFATASVIFGLAPRLSDVIAQWFGISYGPIVVLLVAQAALIIRCLQADIQTTQLERRVRRLTQRLALIEADLHAQSHAPLAPQTPAHELEAAESVRSRPANAACD